MKNNNIKKIRLVLTLAGITLGVGSSYAQTYQAPSVSTDDNYVLSRTYQAPKNVYSEVTLEGEVIEMVNYVDGLGRPRQSVGIGHSPQGEDIVSPIEYDQYGRAKREWLPYVGDSQNPRGAFKPSALSGVQTYYHANYGTDFPNTDAGDTNPYAEKDYEPSPLNRVLKQAAPGTDWALGSDQTDHAIEFAYSINTNADAVRFFEVSNVVTGNTYIPTLVDSSTYYSEGELNMTITRDENHSSGDDHTTEEFTDKQGRVVLKRTYNGGAEHDTYYVYDDYGNLTYVIPPLANITDGVSSSELAELCYQYIYDYRNRLVEKKIPGKGWEHIVYNKLDQPIMTQDSVQRTNDKWLFTKYDVFGRVAYTGKATDARAREVIQSTDVDVLTGNLWVARETGFVMDNITVGYGNTTYPTSTVIEVLTVNYYDDYDFDRANEPTPPTLVFNTDIDDQTKGLATGSKIKVLGTTDWITTVNRYDDKARPIYTYSENEYLGTVDLVESNLDFVGKPIKVRTSHTRNNNTIATLDNFEYDHVGRLLSQTQCIGNENLGYDCNGTIVEPNLVLQGTTVTVDQIAPNSVTVSPVTTVSGDVTLGVNPSLGGSGGPEELIAYNDYDELGQLIQKKVGGTPASTYATTTQNLQTVDYAYNVRGWLKQINNPASLGTDLFAFDINYNTADHGGTALYNGNISETEWKTANDNTLRWYHYGYDALNRITGATGSSSNYNLGLVQYDKNGNIERLTRNGHRDINVTSFGLMDDLTYSYTGNKLQAVDDANPSSAVTGFVDGVELQTEYTYDGNGNMITDANKGIDSIGYNHLNLPMTIGFEGNPNKQITYIYDAMGTKLKKTVNNEGILTTTEYAGNHVYMGTGTNATSLQFFNHPEGYVTPDGLGDYTYVYQYKDHLGNVRLSYTEDPSNPGSPTIIEENNYYPFGLKHKGYNMGGDNSLGNDIAQKYKTYQGQEFTDNLGLNVHEFKYRFYDSAIGRFWSIDPLADGYVYNSPYNFAENSVIANSELEGLEAKIAIHGEGAIGTTTYTSNDINSFHARASTLEKNDGYSAERVKNGQELISALKTATAEEGSVQSAVIFAHGTRGGVVLDPSDGFYINSRGGANAATVSDLQGGINDGSILFEDNSSLVFASCNACSPNPTGTNLAEEITNETGITTIGATSYVVPEIIDGKETGALKTDGTFIKTEKVFDVSTNGVTVTFGTEAEANEWAKVFTNFSSPDLTGDVSSRVIQTDLGNRIDPSQY